MSRKISVSFLCGVLLILRGEPVQSQERAGDKPLILKGATVIDG